jgi:hypothetical protein
LFLGSATAQYADDFEGLLASAAGTAMNGQAGYYIPAVTGSIDGNCFTYAGNTIGVPVNATGGANFWAGASGGGTAFARSEKAITIPANCQVRIDFDICCRYTGTVVPANNIGSVSFQPSATSRVPILLARFPTPLAFPPSGWNADVTLGPTVAGAQTTFPDPNYLNLPFDVWHRWGCTIDLTTAEYVEFRLTNGATSVTTVYTPLPGAMLLTNSVATAMPTAFRMFCGGGLGNVFAIDNLLIVHSASYAAYGTGCVGTAGTPALAAATGSRPVLGGTFQAVLSNLPLSIGIVSTGFNDTNSGPFVLPFDLTPLGLTGCTLFAEVFGTQFLVGSGGSATWSIGLPNSTTYLGAQFYNQGFSLDPGFNPAGFTVSNAGRACLGY